MQIFEKFYHALNCKNLRFYHKVYNYYLEFRNEVGKIDNISDDSKKKILPNILILIYIKEFNPEIIHNNDKLYIDLNLFKKYFPQGNILSLSDRDFISIHDGIAKIFQGFKNIFSLDGWGVVILDSLLSYYYCQETISDTLKSLNMTNKKNEQELVFEGLLSEFYSLTPKENFIDRFHDAAINKIEIDNMNSLSFYVEILKNSNKPYLGDKLENKIKNFIIKCISDNKFDLDNFYPFEKKEYDIFYDFIQSEINECNHNKSIGFVELFLKAYQERNLYGVGDELIKLAENNLTKDDLKKLIWAEDISDTRYRKGYITKILEITNQSSNSEQIRQWAVEILQEKMTENSNNIAPISMWLKQTNNLTELGKQ